MISFKEEDIFVYFIMFLVIICIIYISQNKKVTSMLNSNFAGLLIGLLCIVFFLFIDHKIAILFLLLLVIIYYETIKKNIDKDTEGLNFNTDNLDNTNKKKIDNLISDVENKINFNDNDEEQLDLENIKNNFNVIKNNLSKINSNNENIKKEINNLNVKCKDNFQNTLSINYNEGFIRDKIPEIYRDNKKLNKFQTESFKNSEEINNLKNENLLSQEGRCINEEKNICSEFEDYGKPITLCSNYKDNLFYPIN